MKATRRLRAAERFVLVELQAVLIVQMQRPEFVECHGEIDFIGGIQAGENGMGRFDQAADAFGIARQLRDGESMADGGDIGMVHRLVRLGLDGETDAFVVREHFVERFDEQVDAAAAVFGFAQISSFASEPENENIGAQIVGDIDGTQGAFDGIFAAFRIVAGVGAIDRHGAEPEAGRDHFRRDAGSHPAASSVLWLPCGSVQSDLPSISGTASSSWNIMASKPSFFELVEFPIEGLGRAGGGAVGVLAFTDVPGAEAEFVVVSFCHKRWRR